MTLTSERQTTVVGRLSNIDKFYGGRRILDGISLEVRGGEIVALVGRSGCGKSTILRVLAGLSDDHAGHREVTGAPAVAFQEPRLFPWRDVLANVVYGLNRTPLSRAAARARAELALAEIGLSDHARAWRVLTPIGIKRMAWNPYASPSTMRPVERSTSAGTAIRGQLTPLRREMRGATPPLVAGGRHIGCNAPRPGGTT